MKFLLSKLLKAIASIIGEQRLLYNIMSNENLDIYNLKYYGYLYDTGWIRTIKENKSIDLQGNPIPWNSYSFIDFVKTRLNNQMSLFEYGCGGSTLYYSKLVKKVTSVETDEFWYNFIKERAPLNCTIYLETLEPDPQKYINKVLETGEKFDIISVDAFHRSECTEMAMKALTDRGVLFLDDTEAAFYDNVLEELSNAGFRSIDFWGMSPIVKYKKSTSIFYRDGNILNI